MSARTAKVHLDEPARRVVEDQDAIPFGGELPQDLDALAVEVILVPVDAGQESLESLLGGAGDDLGEGIAVLVGVLGEQSAEVAFQGPAALEVLQPLTGVDLAGMKYYWFANGEVASVRATISRTGYTGEDGFEIFVPPQQADRVWLAILESGK